MPNHVEDGSPTWESALESIELSLGVGDIQDCFHRYVLDDEFASDIGVGTVFASELSLSGSCLDGDWTTLRWTFCGVVSQWDSRGAFASYR